MGTKLNKVPSNEAKLNKLLQDIYLKAKGNNESDIKNNFTGILEIIASKANIITSYVESNEAFIMLIKNCQWTVKNLITVHQFCHDLIHNNTESTSLPKKH